MKTLVSSMLDNFHTASEPFISDHGDRIALKSYSPRDRKKGAAKTDFEFTTYGSQVLKKGHIQTSLQQLEGEATTGHALLWTTENLFPRISNLRKHKVIFDDVEALASHPLDHHLIQIGRIHKPDLDYTVRFLKPFVYSVRREFNQYPPPMLEKACGLIRAEEAHNLLFTSELHEISSGENSFTNQELTSKYEKDKDSEEIASLTSVSSLASCQNLLRTFCIMCCPLGSCDQ
ncbi:Collagen alpha-5(VI) chain [Manis javanica]|nr:Collagen alpha-5(VI) chain [Manis javanica]